MKDIFVANGIYQDLTDLDYINFISNNETQRAIITGEGVNYEALIDSIPINKIPNYAFHNQGGLQFENKASLWGLGEPSHSNGSAYGDLDNDGDLDLVVNNVNSRPFIYMNKANSQKSEHRYLKVILRGEGINKYGVGAKIIAIANDQQFYIEQMPVRGFQSTMDPRPNFGLGTIKKLDKLTVRWPGGKVSELQNVATNQTIEIDESEAVMPTSDGKPEPLKTRIFESASSDIIKYNHVENNFVDFDRDKLTYHMLSNQGPRIAVGDVNSDDKVDLYICGAKGAAGSLYIQQNDGRFSLKNQQSFEDDSNSENIDAAFFDADSDGDADLFVSNGGNEFGANSQDLRNRLYLNDGQGNFSVSEQQLFKNQKYSSSCVETADFDQDGDTDLFVGTRLRPFLYGVPVSGFIYQNDGKGNFQDVTRALAPELLQLGLITSAKWIDTDGDSDLDLVVTGEWMAIEVFNNENGKFVRNSNSGLNQSRGWWNVIEYADLDNDGDQDLILGNHGTNSIFSASKDAPLAMYVNDFDQNGSAEQIYAKYQNGKFMPFVLKHDLVAQMPVLKKKYLKFRNYIGQGIEDIFTQNQLENSIVLTANELRSSIAWNRGNGTYDIKALPVKAQFSPIYAILVKDFNKDGNLDILLGGNFHRSKPEAGKYDANYGQLYLGTGDQQFEALESSESGIFVKGEIRDLKEIPTSNGQYVLGARNNDELAIFKIR